MPPTPLPLAALAERARSSGEEPWLFYRDGWYWQWRSWARAADQVTRSADVLRGFSSAPARVGFDARQHPDAVAAGLAIQAAGHLAVPVRDGADGASSKDLDAWAEVGAGAGRTPPVIELPPAMSPLDKAALRPLVPEAAPAGALELPGRGRTSPADLASAAGRLDRRLPAGAGRPIVCAAPEPAEDAVQLLQAWTLVRGAAWVLEPDLDAFVETVLWARPTAVWASAAALERLASRLAERKHRRHSRVRCVVAVAGGGEIDPAPWRALGAGVVALGEDPLDDEPLCRTAV